MLQFFGDKQCAVHDFIGVGHHQRGENKRQVNRYLEEGAVFQSRQRERVSRLGHFAAHFNERLEEVNRRYPDQRGRQFDFQHPRIDV